MDALALIKSSTSGNIQVDSQRFLSQVSETGKITANLLYGLTEANDEEIAELRVTARQLGIYAWVLECACDAEIWERHKPFKPAPGRSDTEGVGLVAAARARAKEVGCEFRTIRKNYRIFRTFKDVLPQSVQILPEKEFYLIALKHKEDPIEALNLFIEERKRDSLFRPADAKRLLSRRLNEEKREYLENSLENDDSIKQHISEVISRINEFKRASPDKRLVTSYYEEWCRQLVEYLEDYSLTQNEEKVLRSIDRGNHKESQIASHTQLPLRTVILILNELEEREICEFVTQRGETEVARGGHTKLWHRVGDPTGDIYLHQPDKLPFSGDQEDYD